MIRPAIPLSSPHTYWPTHPDLWRTLKDNASCALPLILIP
jgi:hypothetical protein